MIAIAGSLCAGEGMCAEPVYVLTSSPSSIAERDGLKRTLEEYPAHEALWKSLGSVSLTYTVKQAESGLIMPDPCEGLPIRVRLVHGQLKSALYEASGGKCVAGAPARRKGLLLTPSAFFARIEAARRQLACYSSSAAAGCLPTALRVTYDSTLGIPVKMEDYSVEVSDYYWSLTVTNIKKES